MVISLWGRCTKHIHLSGWGWKLEQKKKSSRTCVLQGSTREDDGCFERQAECMDRLDKCRDWRESKWIDCQWHCCIFWETLLSKHCAHLLRWRRVRYEDWNWFSQKSNWLWVRSKVRPFSRSYPWIQRHHVLTWTLQMAQPSILGNKISNWN